MFKIVKYKNNLIYRIATRDKKKFVNLAKPSLLCEKLIWFRDNIDNTIEQYTPDTLSLLVEKYVLLYVYI